MSQNYQMTKLGRVQQNSALQFLEGTERKLKSPEEIVQTAIMIHHLKLVKSSLVIFSKNVNDNKPRYSDLYQI